MEPKTAQTFSLYNWIQSKWDSLIKPDEQSSNGPLMSKTERITIYLICYGLAVAMWGLVNLGREFEFNMNVPVSISNLPNDVSLKENLVESVNVVVSGEGWMLMNIQNATINLDVSLTNEQKATRVNLVDYMRKELSTYPNVTLINVEPSFAELSLSKKVTKKVAIKPNVSVQFKTQFNFVDDARLFPDSILISGAESLLNEIQFVETDFVQLSDIKDPINIEVPIRPLSKLIEMERSQVQYRAKVAEFTEGEIRVVVKAAQLPEGVEVRFNPSVISIKYDVPIEEYTTSQTLTPFSVYVNYSDLERDTTGFVTPIIKNLAPNLHLNVRSYQPKRVSYYNVINQ